MLGEPTSSYDNRGRSKARPGVNDDPLVSASGDPESNLTLDGSHRSMCGLQRCRNRRGQNVAYPTGKHEESKNRRGNRRVVLCVARQIVRKTGPRQKADRRGSLAIGLTNPVHRLE